jgi:hypothetical protein
MRHIDVQGLGEGLAVGDIESLIPETIGQDSLS